MRKNSLSVARNRELDARFAKFREQLVDRIFKAACLLALIYLPILAWRVSDVGWSPQLKLHALLVAFSLATPFLLRRMSLAVKSTLLIVIFLSLGIAGVFSMGMMGTGYWWCLQSAVLAATLYSLRIGVYTALASTGLFAAASGGFVTGVLTAPVDLNAHIVSPSAWGAFLAVVLFAPSALLLATRGYQSLIEQLAAELDAQRSKLEELVGHDPLTGLPQSGLVVDRLETALNKARRMKEQVGVLFLDLDGFKRVDDVHGHAAGDHLLQQIAARLKAALRAEDTIGRVGGDEFLVILWSTDEPGATSVAQKLIEQVNVPVVFQDAALRVGVSVGIALFPHHGEEAQLLRRRADKAMYEAKRMRGNAHALATVSPHAAVGQYDDPR